MKDNLIKLIASFFYIGYLPAIPGTFGSLAGVLIYFFLVSRIWLYLAVVILIGAVGFLICAKAEDLFNQKDSPRIVIDEVLGILIALILIPAKIHFIILGFLIFRALDAVKPMPFDRLQRFSGSLGIMADDIGAGLYTNFILQIILRFNSG